MCYAFILPTNRPTKIYSNWMNEHSKYFNIFTLNIEKHCKQLQSRLHYFTLTSVLFGVLYSKSSSSSSDSSSMRMVLCKLRINTEYFHSQFRRPAAKTWVPEVTRKNEIENSMGNGTLNSTKCVCVAIFLGSYLGFTVHTECVYSFVLIANIAPAKRSRILFHAIHYTFVYCKCILCVSLRLELMLPLRFKLKSRVFSYLLTLFLSIAVVLCRSLSHSLHVCMYVFIFYFFFCRWKVTQTHHLFSLRNYSKGIPDALL